MPKLISKQEALDSLRAKEYGSCWACAIISDHPRMLWEDEHCKVVLSEYPRYWGHALVLLKRHITSYSEMTSEEAESLFKNGHRIAKMIEQKLNPVRCFMAGVGTERTDVPHSSPHLHLNVIPVFKESARPAKVFTWENGIYTGTEAEWTELVITLTQFE